MPRRLLRAKARFPSSLPVRYAGWALGQVLFYLALALLLIEAIFLAEELPNVLERLLDVTNAETRPWDVVLILLTRTPEVFDLALPVALLIATYRVALRCRENRELLVLAGVGIGVHQLIYLTLVIGVVAQVVSLIVTGAIEPHLRFAQRQTYFELGYRVLREGTASGDFFTFPSHVVYVLPAGKNAAQRPVFIDEIRGDGTERISTARHAVLQPIGAGDELKLQLRDVVADEFQLANGERSVASASPVSTSTAEAWVQPLRADELMRFQPRGKSVAELTDWELLGWSVPVQQSAKARTTELAERFARSLLCLLAPLLAGLAVIFTTEKTRAVALPIACSLLMCCGIGFSALVSLVGPVGRWPGLGLIWGCAMLLLVFCVRWITRCQQRLIKPELVGH